MARGVAESKQLEFVQSSLEHLDTVMLQRLETLSQQGSQSPQPDKLEEPPSSGSTRERWPVRTVADLDRSEVNPKIVPTTMADLIAQKRPTDMPFRGEPVPKYHSRRAATVETTIWSVVVSVRASKLHLSGSYRLIVQDEDGRTMNVEVPDPVEVDQTSPWLSWFVSVREKLKEKLQFRTSYSYLDPPIPARLDGLGFFSRFHGKTGTAPNGVELQPIIDLKWLRRMPSKGTVTVKRDVKRHKLRRTMELTGLHSKKSNASPSAKSNVRSKSKSAKRPTAKKRSSRRNLKKR